MAANHFSEGKSAVDQIPPELLLEWGEVFGYGAKKYGRDNWKGGKEWYEFYGSALRHLYRWYSGEDNDEESQLPHLAHVLWNIGCLRYYQNHNLGVDTRDKKIVTITNLIDRGAIAFTERRGMTGDGVYDRT